MDEEGLKIPQHGNPDSSLLLGLLLTITMLYVACSCPIAISGVRLCWELEEPNGPKGQIDGQPIDGQIDGAVRLRSSITRPSTRGCTQGGVPSTHTHTHTVLSLSLYTHTHTRFSLSLHTNTHTHTHIHSCMPSSRQRGAAHKVECPLLSSSLLSLQVLEGP